MVQSSPTPHRSRSMNTLLVYFCVASCLLLLPAPVSAQEPTDSPTLAPTESPTASPTSSPTMLLSAIDNSAAMASNLSAFFDLLDGANWNLGALSSNTEKSTSALFCLFPHLPFPFAAFFFFLSPHQPQPVLCQSVFFSSSSCSIN